MGHYLNIGFILFTFSYFLENSTNKRTIQDWLDIPFHLDDNQYWYIIDPVKTFIADNDFGMNLL